MSTSRLLFTGVVLCLIGCATKPPTARYSPPPDRVYSADRDTVWEAALVSLAEIGLQVFDMEKASGRIRTGLMLGTEGVDCASEWKGLDDGRLWEELSGGLHLTVVLLEAEDGTAVRLREIASSGCVPTGEMGEAFFASLNAQLGQPISR